MKNRQEVSLARLLESAHLPAIVPRLAPETLQQLIQARGLGACAEIVALVTPAQLGGILDIDLWRADTGQRERFDAGRFGVWLETLVDEDEAMAARMVASMETGLVILGLSRHIRVLDPASFVPSAQTDDEQVDSGVRGT